MRSTPPHRTSSLSSRCAVGFGSPVRAASSVRFSSVSAEPKASSRLSPRASTDLGGSSPGEGTSIPRWCP
ncbi:hypothetical protein LUX57_52170 [Actinomadura madurae]|nr:hypothetical protein [Actinomadura madurae]MCP9972587.1 hypothetical protein [Actinomadura madurae]